MMDVYNESILDDTVEDILWVKLVDKVLSTCISICVCYLSPEGSSRQVDPYNYFDNLLSQIYIYQNAWPYIICGDFNARCGEEVDFIEGVDNIPHRDIIDFRKNV